MYSFSWMWSIETRDVSGVVLLSHKKLDWFGMAFPEIVLIVYVVKKGHATWMSNPDRLKQMCKLDAQFTGWFLIYVH